MRKLHSFDRAKNTALSNKLKSLRAALGLSQKDIANDLNVTQAYYGQLEKNPAHMSIDTLMKVAGILKSTVFEILASLLPVENRPMIAAIDELISDLQQPGRFVKGFIFTTNDKDNA